MIGILVIIILFPKFLLQNVKHELKLTTQFKFKIYQKYEFNSK